MRALSFFCIAFFSSFLSALETLSIEKISLYVDREIHEAAQELGVCETVLKKACRKHGIARWPYRRVNSVQFMLNNLENFENPDQIKQQLDEVLEKYRSGLINEGDILYEKYITKTVAKSFSKKKLKKRKARDFEKLFANTENSNKESMDQGLTQIKKLRKVEDESDFQLLLERAQTNPFFKEAPLASPVEELPRNKNLEEYNSDDEDDWHIITDEEELEEMKKDLASEDKIHFG